MRLSSDDIQKQEFGVKFFGFDKDEVRIFLKVVATEYEELVNEIEVLKKQLEEREAQVRLVSETREEVREILEAMRQFSKESMEVARGSRGLIEEEMKRRGEEVVEGIRRIREEMVSKEGGYTTKEDLKAFLQTIERTKREEIERAEVEASQIIREAEVQTDEMIKEAEKEVESMRKEIADLKRQYRAFEDRMKGIIESQLSMLRKIGSEEEGDERKEDVGATETDAEGDAHSPFTVPDE
ncbi:MAG TPA: DivIVA domain-containing protein [Thermodesulfobacteriota bacterium]|nr:DivIVA domain-containing protein [Thermodesulfobacteriota bacterium]